MKDTTRIVLYQKALKHLHKALLPGQVWAFSGAMEAAGIVRIDEYLAKKIAYQPEHIFLDAFVFEDTEEGEEYWSTINRKWFRYLKQHIEEIDDEVRKVLS